MDREQLQRSIDELTVRLDEDPQRAELYIERGKCHYQLGGFDKAFNDFIRARQLDPGNVEAGEYMTLISEIFEFRHTDLYNP